MISKILFILSFLSLNLVQAQDVFVQMSQHTLPPLQKKEFEYIQKSIGAINPELRDRLFNDVGLLPYLKNYDDVERNVLYLRLKRLPFNRILNLYGSLPESSLKRIYEILGDQR